MRAACETCRFFAPDPGYSEHGGRCHFNPPIVTVYVHLGSRTPEWTSERPWVERTDWCGRHEQAAKQQRERQRVEPKSGLPYPAAVQEPGR